MGSAPVSEALMAATHQAFPKATVTNAYGTTEAGPVVFGPHPKGLPQPENFGRLSASQGAVAPRGRHQPQRRSGRAGDEMPGADERLSQPARREAAVHRRRLLHHRRRVPPRRDGFHYFLGRTDDMFVSGGENIYPADVERMLETHPDVGQAVVDPGGRRHQGHQAGRLCHPEGRPASRPRTRSRNTRWRTRRPFSTRASSGSSTNCRLRPPTRWIARR